MKGLALLYFVKTKFYMIKTKNLIFLSRGSKFKKINGPYLAIAKINDRYIYVINIDSKDEILGIFMNPDTTNFIDLINILAFLDPESFLIVSRASILNNWHIRNTFVIHVETLIIFDLEEGAFKCECKNALNYPSISPCIITLIHMTMREFYLAEISFFQKICTAPLQVY